MKIPMHLTEPVGIILQTPAPAHGSVLNIFQQLCGKEWMAGVAVGQTHDAFAAADQFANATKVQLRFIPLCIVDLDQIIAERVGAGPVLRSRVSTVAQAL